MLKSISLLATAFVLAGTTTLAKETPMEIRVELKNAAGESAGTAMLTQLKDGVKIKVNVKGLQPGPHGIHFHENGKCEGPEFKTAGSHFGGQKHHGMKNPLGAHSGDLPNLTVKADGTAATELMSKTVTLKPGSNSLLQPAGTAIVVHAKEDDQKSDPSGNSGDRVACGVISPG